MADSDPFECRLNFLALLEKLNASQHSIQKVANYAVRHRNLAEDLYSCLLEQLDKASINARVNIVYVLDAIFAISHKVRFKGYHDLTRKDLPRIIETVVPNDAKGSVNIGNTRKILDNWRRRSYFDSETIDQVEKPLLDREAAAAGSSQTAGEGGFSKEDMLRRMEEDRERHKRFREEVWIRSAEESVDAEFQQLWESTEPLVPETDYEVMMLQNMLRLPHYAWHMMLEQRTMATNNSNGVAPSPSPQQPPQPSSSPATPS
ncbi:CTD kinase subunit gamma CTK3-domain-containing protein [Fennellomyces sp. T-0311]|nr:CTD kinase subunit gamma CTK3-domain-containing protein [Fennellomyces sp. T-0311]